MNYKKINDLIDKTDDIVREEIVTLHYHGETLQAYVFKKDGKFYQVETADFDREGMHPEEDFRVVEVELYEETVTKYRVIPKIKYYKVKMGVLWLTAPDRVVSKEEDAYTFHENQIDLVIEKCGGKKVFSHEELL